MSDTRSSGPRSGDWAPPTAQERKAILDRTRTVAVVGASSKSSRPSNFVATYLLSSSADFEIYFVNPRETEIYGNQVYASLADLPVVPDLVDVFRRPEDLPSVCQEVIDIGAHTFWAQLGLFSQEAAGLGHAAGLDVVMDRCLKIEHARFHGGLHLGGFDTGVISSRRALP